MSYVCCGVQCIEVGANEPWDNFAFGLAAPPTRKTASQNTRPCTPSPFAGWAAVGRSRRAAIPTNQNFATDPIENPGPPKADPPEAPKEL